MDIDIRILFLSFFVSLVMSSFGSTRCFPLSEFHILDDPPLPFFTHSSIDHFSSTTDITPPIELDISSPENFKHVTDPDTPYKQSTSDNSSLIKPLTTFNPTNDGTYVDHVSQSVVPPPTRQFTRVRELHHHLHDYHCYSIIFSHHKPSSYKKKLVLTHFVSKLCLRNCRPWKNLKHGS